MSFRDRLVVFTKMDWVMLSAMLILVAIGFAILYSLLINANDPDLARYDRQIIAGILGGFLFVVLSLLNYRILENYTTILYVFSILLLVVVLIFGVEIRGTQGWLIIGGVSFQPVELVKFLYVIILAKFLADHTQDMHEWKVIAMSMVGTAVIVGLIMAQGEIGSILLILAVWFGTLFLTSIKRWQLLLIAVLGIAFALLTFFFILEDSQKARLIVFIDRENPVYRLGIGYNIDQSIVAVGSGQLMGRGLGLGPQSQLNFLPEQETDFIFAAIAEELGFLGAMTVIACFVIIFYRIVRLAARSRDDFAVYMSWGVAILLFVQVFINIGMNVGLAPVTGIPLPFISAGGSALVVNLAAMGLLQGLAIRGNR